MKYIRKFPHILAAIATLLCVACTDETTLGGDWSPSLTPRRLSLSAYDLKMPIEGGMETVNVTSENANWNFAGNDAGWLTLAPKSGNGSAAVSLTAQPNTDPTTGRSVAYAFACTNSDWQMTRPFSVSQSASGYYIRPVEKNFTKAAPATQFEVGIEANASWEAKSDVSWLTIQTTPTSLKINLTDNTTSLSADRIGHITLTCGKATEIVTVNQQPPNITVATDELVYENEGGDKHIEVKSDVAWTASCSQSWMTLSPAEGAAGTTSLLLRAAKNASANSRTANVYINIGGNKMQSIPIRQLGLYVDASVSSLPAFAYQGGSQTLTITTNTDWTVINKPDFVTVSPTAGSKGTTTVTVTAPANNSDRSLSGDITFGNASITGLQTKIHVEQDCATFGLSEQTITVPSVAGSSHNLTITADQSWTAAFAQGKWAHVTPSTGDGTATITLMADDNPSIKEREDVLTITPSVTKTPLTFRFIQSGRVLEVNTTELTIHPKGGTSDPLIVTTDGTYQVSKEGDWFTIAQDANSITATATANEGEVPRSGTIIVTMTNLPSGESLIRTITVRQYPPDNIEGGGFTDDRNWDFDDGGSDATITVGNFTNDINWDFDAGGSDATITGGGFTDDKNWDF